MDKDQSFAIFKAAKNNNLEDLEALAAAGLNLGYVTEGDKYTVLTSNLSSPFSDLTFETVEYLLDQGVPINQADYTGSTALHYAVEKKKPDIVALLLERGAEINAMDFYGKTPLHMATSLPRIQSIIDMLFAAGADPDLKKPDMPTGSARDVYIRIGGDRDGSRFGPKDT